MKLYGSVTSPYVRKVRIVLHEKDIPHEFIAEGPSDPAGNVARLNPLGKVPVMVRDDGEVLFDSPLIVDYLDSLKGEPLVPRSGEARWQVLRWHALGQGVLDAVVARLMEGRRAPEKQEAKVIARQEGKVAAALHFAEERCPGEAFLVNKQFSLADITLLVALEYIDLRYEHDWRSSHPHLATWWLAHRARKSYQATRPE